MVRMATVTFFSRVKIPCLSTLSGILCIAFQHRTEGNQVQVSPSTLTVWSHSDAGFPFPKYLSNSDTGSSVAVCPAPHPPLSE